MSRLPKSVGIRLFADENISFDVIKPLKKLGIDIQAGPKGLKNGELFRTLVRIKRILLTHDKDFLDSHKFPVSKTAGIVYIPIHPPIGDIVVKAIKNMLEKITAKEISGKLIILKESGFLIEPTSE